MDKGASETAVFYDHFFTHWHVGDWATIAGLVLAIVGFGVTVYQVREAKKAAASAKSSADQATAAANAALNHRRILDSNAALTEASVRLNEIKSMVLVDQAVDTVIRYDTVCEHVGRVREEEGASGREHHVKRLADVLRRLRVTQASTLKLSRNPESKINPERIHQELSDVQDELNAIGVSIRNTRS
ncbi:hypothetical protein NLY09_14185 (plasmid) [Burkholderia vietnamiensis]|jgi:hypothetical protein